MAIEESSPESHEYCRHHVVLDKAAERSSIFGHQILSVSGDWQAGESLTGSLLILALTNVVGLGTCQLILGKMCIHFISVKVGVVALAVGVMQSHCLFPGQNTCLQRKEGAWKEGASVEKVVVNLVCHN